MSQSDKNSLEIVIPKPTDAESVYELFRKTWLETYPNDKLGITKDDVSRHYLPENKAAKLVRFRDYYQKLNDDFENQDMWAWVAKVNSKVIGIVTYDREIPAKVGALYVLPSHHGEGVGKALMQHVLEIIGNQEVVVNVASYNSKAIEFYKKFGFAITGAIEDKVDFGNGKYIPEIQMRKII